ncbi:NAD(P)/FAD-dependent oxidoreductase [Aliamphritea ceti]|uniref:NAD(P)/FAD-dependent oxidoreductase n=1 Tax=Aliamphritea ceti TaxID=1524258 RepID=UPI0021C34E0B|nr:NAD(P)/FAD-dependent oxidoreductase [Aliamphritea ceti]
MSEHQGRHDVIIIGAGPSGAVAAALLNKRGYKVLVIEKSYFPRFSIGESLLPQCMQFLEDAGLLSVVEQAGFQSKNGAAFSRGDEYDYFDFREKLTPGYGTTYQVRRDKFDKLLIDEAEAQGVQVTYGHTVTDFELHTDGVLLTVTDEALSEYRLQADFVLDASGFGRVLPRLLGLDKPSAFESRTSVFTHVEDRIDNQSFDREKILISVHPENQQIWYWLIPFSDGRASVGVVTPPEVLENLSGSDLEKLKTLIGVADFKADLLGDAVFDSEVGKIQGYACDVEQLYGERFALLGNAGEFLDPVFSSGVTIALKSATLAVQTLDQHLSGLEPDWQEQFADPLQKGIDTFRNFVEGWYDGRLQDVIFSAEKNPAVSEMISSILAGYAWDDKNPFVKNPARLSVLAELCRNAERGKQADDR